MKSYKAKEDIYHWGRLVYKCGEVVHELVYTLSEYKDKFILV